jgi:hypothetical protein
LERLPTKNGGVSKATAFRARQTSFQLAVIVDSSLFALIGKGANRVKAAALMSCRGLSGRVRLPALGSVLRRMPARRGELAGFDPGLPQAALAFQPLLRLAELTPLFGEMAPLMVLQTLRKVFRVPCIPANVGVLGFALCVSADGVEGRFTGDGRPDPRAQVRAESDKPGASKTLPAWEPIPFAMHCAPLLLRSCNPAFRNAIHTGQRIKASTKRPHCSRCEPQCGVFVLTETPAPFIGIGAKRHRLRVTQKLETNSPRTRTVNEREK